MIVISDPGLAQQVPVLTLACDVATELMKNMTGLSNVEASWLADITGRETYSGRYHFLAVIEC